MSTPSDEALMEAYQAGEPEAFEALFGRHAPGLGRYFRGRGFDGVVTQDLIQQTFLQFHRSRFDFQAGARVKPWIYTIALNVGRHEWRRRRRKPESSMDLEPGTPGVLVDKGEREILPHQLERALAALPGHEREVLVLHWMQGFSFRELSEALGISVSASKVRASRAYARLRTFFGSR